MRKVQLDKALPELEKDLEFEVGGSKDYEVEAIIDSAVYSQQTKSNQKPDFYYFVSWKCYLEEEHTCKPLSAVWHFRKLINTFHKDHPEKPIGTSPLLDSVSPMARPTVSK